MEDNCPYLTDRLIRGDFWSQVPTISTKVLQEK